MQVIKNLNEISESLTIIDFFATWCGPCRMLTPVLEEINEEGIVKVVKVDVDEASDLAREFKIQVVPTLYVLKNKEVVSKKEGYMSKEEIIKWIQEFN